MAYVDRPLDNSIGTDMTLREGCDLINDNFEVLAADKLKLDGIEVGAQVNSITSVAGQTGDVVLTKSDVGLNNVDDVQQAPITRTITAGTGLTGGGDLTADRTLSVSYGTTAGTAAQGNDSRLSDAREWTATVVSQAEAEAGTATTARKWTAERVRQAIAAWWNTIGTAFGKTLLGSTDAATARGTLELGDTSTKDVATSAEALAGTADVLPDAAGVHAAFNQYGLGGELPTIGVSIDSFDIPSGDYFTTAATLGTFPAGVSKYGNLTCTHVSNDIQWQMYRPDDNVGVDIENMVAVRTGFAGALNQWSDWQVILHSGNGATNAEALTGLITDKWVSPANVKHVLDNTAIGNAVTATKLATARTIGGVSFDGTANIDLPGVNTAGNQNTSGNAATATLAAAATELATARTIGGVSFNGTANINLPGVNTTGNQNTTGNAATATTLQTARSINGTSFNGSANITTANWGTARTINIAGSAKSVNGSGNVTWSLADLKLNASLAANGYQRLPSGLIIQWGTRANGGTGYYAVTFPIAFPSVCVNVQTTYNRSWEAGDYRTVHGVTRTGAQVGTDGSSTFWLAIGY